MNLPRLSITGQLVIILLSTSASAGNINTSRSDDFVEAGDILQIALPALGYTASLYHRDLEGAKQLTYSLLTSAAIVNALKLSLNRERPNENKNWDSFPSGHTAAAFSGAAYLQSRYGPWWGIPAYAAAVVVGASRIHGRRHFSDDVIAGASISFLVNQIYLSKYFDPSIRITPKLSNKGVGVNLNIDSAYFDKRNNTKITDLGIENSFNNSFELRIGTFIFNGRVKLDGNKIPKENDNSFNPYVKVFFDHRIDKYNSVNLFFSSKNDRDTVELATAQQWRRATYPAGSKVLKSYHHSVFGADYYYRFFNNSIVQFKAGAGLAYHYLKVEIDTLDQNNYTGQSRNIMMASLALQTYLELSKQIYFKNELSFHINGGESYFIASSSFYCHLNKNWDVGLTYTHQKELFDDKLLDVKKDVNAFTLSIINQM